MTLFRAGNIVVPTKKKNVNYYRINGSWVPGNEQYTSLDYGTSYRVTDVMISESGNELIKLIPHDTGKDYNPIKHSGVHSWYLAANFNLIGHIEVTNKRPAPIMSTVAYVLFDNDYNLIDYVLYRNYTRGDVDEKKAVEQKTKEYLQKNPTNKVHVFKKEKTGAVPVLIEWINNL